MDWKHNAGKLGLVGVLLLAAAVAYFGWGGTRAPSRDSSIQFVCVETGETFWVPRGKTRFLPLENEETGRRTLLPCAEHENGELYVTSRARSLVKQLDEEGLNKCVDLSTLVVHEP